MINIESIRYSLRNLEHRKGRSLLTIFSILVGIATIFIFISFGLGLYNYTQSLVEGSSANKVLVLAKGAGAPGLDTTFKLLNEDLEEVKKAGGVYEASGVYSTIVEIKKRNERIFSFAISYDPKVPLLLDTFGIGEEKGRLLVSSDQRNVIAGYNYLLDGKIFDKGLDVNDKIEVNGVKLKIVGFLESVGNPQDDSQIYMTNDYFKELFPNVTSYSEIVARVDISNIDGAISNIEKNLRKHRGQDKGKEDFQVQSFEDLLENFSSVLNIIIGFIILIALISVLVSAINTANTMITSVLERYKEIGVLKAIGAKNSDVFGVFLFESSFLGFVAGSLGVLIGYGVTYIAGVFLKSLGWGFLSPFYSQEIFLGCIIFATLTGAISGVIPAIKASKTNTVDALRYE